MSEAVVEVDARDLLCPMPILRSDQAMAGLRQGDRMRILATDPGFKNDLPAWCAVNGHSLIQLSRKGRLWTAVVEKGA
ncbi:MAG: sulfurtransferase TusA family protein [Magnetococcales bacterium]|nr:sulfurtransferase TusA family protein [Magnetococcales bacterium]